MDPAEEKWILIGWLTTPDGTPAAYVGEQAGAWWYRIDQGAPIGPYATAEQASAAGRTAIGVDAEALMQMLRQQAGEGE